MATLRTSVAGGGSTGTGNRTVTITPAVGDLFVVFVNVSVNSNTAPTMTDDNGGTYSLINTALYNSSANTVSVFVRDKFLSNTTSTVITANTGSNTSGSLVVCAIAGMTRNSLDAVRQTAREQNVVSAGTVAPAPAFGVNALIGNFKLGGVGNLTNPTGLTAPSGFSTAQDTGQNSPPEGLDVVTNPSLFSGTTVTWGSNSASNFGDIIVELDATIATLPLIENNVTESKNQVEPPKQNGGLTLGANLLLTTLAVVAAPFVSHAIDSAPQRPIWLATPQLTNRQVVDISAPKRAPLLTRVERPRDVTDTSQFHPLSLQAVVAAPFTNAPHFGPQQSFNVIDTSQGQPAPLKPVSAAAPFVTQPINRPQSWPWMATSLINRQLVDISAPTRSVIRNRVDRVWEITDTSLTQPVTLRPVVNVPIFNAPQFVPVKFFWQPEDTSQGTPQEFRPDQIPPVQNKPHFAPPAERRIGSETSYGSSTALVTSVPSPFLPAWHLPPLRFFWQPADTSQGIAKVSRPDQIPPISVEPHFAPQDTKRILSDTSEGTAKVLTPDQIPPVQDKPHFAPQDTKRILPDTSVGTAKVLTPDQIPPTHVAPPTLPILEPINNWLPADTSQGQPAVLKPRPSPFAPQAQFGPIRFFWQPQDVSQSTPPGFYPATVLPPGKTVQLGPVKFFYQPPDTSQIAGGNFYPPPPPPAVSPMVHSWFVKAIGIKTKTSVAFSQVDSDTGDTP